LFPETDPGAVAARNLMASSPYQDKDTAIMRSHMLYLACHCMYVVAQFTDLEYDSFLGGLPDETLRLLFGLQLISARAQPLALDGLEDPNVFYHMLAYRRALCLHNLDPKLHPLPSQLPVGEASKTDVPETVIVPPSLQEVEALAGAARSRHRAMERRTMQEALTAVSSQNPATTSVPEKVLLISGSRSGWNCVELRPSRKSLSVCF